jgi:hypothetical protein
MYCRGRTIVGYVFCHYLGERWAVGSGTAPQDRKFWVRFPVVSLEIFIWHIPSVRLQYPWGSTQPVTERSTAGVKFGRRLGQTTLPSWCAEFQSKDRSPTFHHRSESSWLFFTGKLYLLPVSIISPMIHGRLYLSQSVIDLASYSYSEQYSSVSIKWVLNNILLTIVVPLTLTRVLNNW